MEQTTLILGAGVSGLAAARTLSDSNHPVVLIDKGRGVGGRAATRKLGDRSAPRGRWDHGAQFATFRSPALLSTLKRWGALDVLTPWHAGPDGLDRHISPEGFNAFAKALANGLEIHNSLRITSLTCAPDGWTVQAESGETFSATHIISTLPAPQLIDLLEASHFELPAIEALKQIHYHRNLTLMAKLDGPSGLQAPGCLRPESGILKLIVDNVHKGISEADTVTAQATPDFSLEWYDRDRATAASVLRAALQEIVESPITAVQIHGWKFAEAVRRHPEPFIELSTNFRAAGDGFMAGDEHVSPEQHARIESALLSGIAAASGILSA
ncbi:MAG: FAD-dependent oxidoreductase [Verrucomicrobia bacterium]|nr:FAD-dependent oxidoreductase [Verrucomicrobiota bacterium]MCH8525769.1 FAD-dependent oxidoreductase [Kiritimatiellia bacterium]